MENYAVYVQLAGLGLALAALVWLLVAAFRQRLWWGLGTLLFLPVGFVFAARHPRRGLPPVVLLLLGVAVFAFPAAYTRLVPVLDLGPREELVNDEVHITLTGWDRDDYAVLRQKRDVVVLQMANPDVTDETLRYLAGMDRLRQLDLGRSAVTDAGLAHLKSLPNLKVLHLTGTAVTDAGLRDHLADLPSLERLDVRETAVTAEGAQAWRDGDPKKRRVLR